MVRRKADLGTISVNVYYQIRVSRKGHPIEYWTGARWTPDPRDVRVGSKKPNLPTSTSEWTYYYQVFSN